jgi:alpha-ribazole phosphatase
MSKRLSPIPTRLYLIRHGEVSKVGYCNGQIDVKLTTRGRRQMERVARLLHSYPIRAVYSSDLGRTIYGARKVADHHKLKVRVHPELREKHFGRWEGLSLDKIKHRYQKEWNEWLRRPDRARPSRGENYLEVEKRVFPILEKILGLHKGQHVAIVSHGGVNRVVLCKALGLDLRHLFHIEQSYACINVIDYNHSGRVVQLVNGQHVPQFPKKGAVMINDV